jgi:histidyl-tRNA synthetase
MIEEDYKSFIEKIIQDLGVENDGYLFRTLPIVEHTEVFTKRMIGDSSESDSVVELVFKEKDLYYIG